MKRQPVPTVYFSPQIQMSVEDIVTALENASRDFIFNLIVALEASQQDAEFLEQVWKHFDAEMMEQEKSA